MGIFWKENLQLKLYHFQYTNISNFHQTILYTFVHNCKFLYENISETNAHCNEMNLIEIIGRKDKGLGPLINKTSGGEGWYGSKHTEEAKRKISEATKGEKHPMYGKKLSGEHKRKISNSLKGRILSEEWKRKISESNKGKHNCLKGRKHTEEEKQKMREAQMGKKNHNYGKHHSPETKQKISESNKGKHRKKCN